MDKRFIAQRVFNKLISAEDAVDGGFAEATELMSVMLQARKELGADIKFADDAQAKLMDAMKSLSEARTSMAELHKELGEARLRLGIRTTMGGVDSQNQFLADEAEATTLRQVG